MHFFTTLIFSRTKRKMDARGKNLIYGIQLKEKLCTEELSPHMNWALGQSCPPSSSSCWSTYSRWPSAWRWRPASSPAYPPPPSLSSLPPSLWWLLFFLVASIKNWCSSIFDFFSFKRSDRPVYRGRECYIYRKLGHPGRGEVCPAPAPFSLSFPFKLPSPSLNFKMMLDLCTQIVYHYDKDRRICPVCALFVSFRSFF